MRRAEIPVKSTEDILWEQSSATARMHFKHIENNVVVMVEGGRERSNPQRTNYTVPNTTAGGDDKNYGSYGMNSAYWGDGNIVNKGPGNGPGILLNNLNSPATTVQIADAEGSYQIDWQGQGGEGMRTFVRFLRFVRTVHARTADNDGHERT